jgi:hypothetical protein
MGTEGGRLASIGIAGLMMCLVDLPYAALGHGETDVQMSNPASFGSAPSEPPGGNSARAQVIVVAQARAINQVVPADQLNEVDRAATNDVFRDRTTGASGNPTRRMAPAIVAATDTSIWDTTSWVGKVFVIFGALLTVASAARMFIA